MCAGPYLQLWEAQRPLPAALGDGIAGVRLCMFVCLCMCGGAGHCGHPPHPTKAKTAKLFKKTVQHEDQDIWSNFICFSLKKTNTLEISKKYGPSPKPSLNTILNEPGFNFVLLVCGPKPRTHLPTPSPNMKFRSF